MERWLQAEAKRQQHHQNWLQAQAQRQQQHDSWLRVQQRRQELAKLLLANLLKLVTPGDTIELRVPTYFTRAYHYDQLSEMAVRAVEFDGVTSVYYTLNPVQPNLVTNATNKSTVVRRYFYVDIDPDRLDYDPEGKRLTSDWCVTDAEKAAAYTMMVEVREYLRSLGWPDPAIIDSGNGWALLYKIDVPTQDNDLIKNCLRALKARFEGVGVNATIDVKVASAGRFTKVPGTLNCKISIPGRPRRRSALISVPELWTLVPVELLEALAQLAPISIIPSTQPKSGSDNLVEVIQGDTGTTLLSDTAIIRRAGAAGNRRKFNRLWAGDTSGYQSHSDADEALLFILAFWTNRDPETMDRLFRQSGLYRDKWERNDYRARSIQSACDKCTVTYRPSQSRKSPTTGHPLVGPCPGIDNLRNLLSNHDED
jgi:hypothetical protein